MKQLILTGFSLLLFGNAVFAVETDDLGIRRFSKVPAAGVHPRVLFSPEDLPAWREQVIKTHKGAAFFAKPYQSKLIDSLAAVAEGRQDKDLVQDFSKYSGPVHDLMFATMDVMVRQDAAQQAKVTKAVTNFARLVLARSKSGDKNWGAIQDHIGGVNGLKGIPTGLGQLWYRGGSSFALSYDFLFNDMTREQQALCRKALSVATKDLVSWGMGFPKGRAVSNWYGYHGEMGIMMLAIEGEDGWDPAHYQMFTNMLHNWFDTSFHPDGGGNEDGYTANTALRETTIAMIAMARRGDNLFRHPNYLPYWTWAIQSLIPGEHGGSTVSYACNAMNPYESMPTLSRWAMPGNPLVNFYYRQYKGADYSQHNNWQYADLSTLLAADWEDSAKLPLDPAKLNLPLTATFERLGLMITRSDWTGDASQLNFYCRQDAWMDRHENIDRGRFTFCALGRQWIGGPWNKVESDENETIMHINGKGQHTASVNGRMSVPNGNLIARFDSPAFTAGCMDLKRAYDWQWCNNFKNPGPGWEPESSTFEELGWIWKNAAMPRTLHGADDPDNPRYNFSGMNLWRKLANPVRFAFRTCALARGAHPYVVVIDDFQKDAQAHQYDSYLQLPQDVVLKESTSGAFILSEMAAKNQVPGKNRVLLQLLGEPALKVFVEDYSVNGPKNGKEACRRIVIRANAVSPDFKFLLYALKEGEPLPDVRADTAQGTAVVKWKDQQDEFRFARGKDGLTRLSVQRDGKKVFGGFDEIRIHPSAKPATDAR